MKKQQSCDFGGLTLPFNYKNISHLCEAGGWSATVDYFAADFVMRANIFHICLPLNHFQFK